jgi:hypothetical protein
LGWEIACRRSSFYLTAGRHVTLALEGENPMTLERWEHLVITLEAIGTWGQGEDLKYHPQALVHQLDAYGQQGWELVSAQPVVLGPQGDVTYVDESMERRWTHTYLCFFKRRKPEE